jgi:hypothetical protein
MGLFSRDDPSKQLRSQAESLLDYARVNAAGMGLPLAQQFPAVVTIAEPADWNYCLTIAGVFVAASRLSDLDIAADLREELAETIMQKVRRWDGRAEDDCLDCQAFFLMTSDSLAKLDTYQGEEQRYLPSDALGFWIMRTLLKRSPSTEAELALTRTVGSAAIHAFFDWWKV